MVLPQVKTCFPVLLALLCPLTLAVEIPTGHIISSTRFAARPLDNGRVEALDYSSTDDVLFIAGGNGNVNFYRGREERLYSGGTGGAPLTTIAYLASQDLTVVGREDGLLRFLQGQLGGIVGDVQENAVLGVVTAVTGLAYDDDVQSYEEVASASLDSTVKIWDSASRTRMRQLEGHRLAVLCLAYLPAPEMLVSGGLDGQIGFWSMPRATMLGHKVRCKGSKQFLGTALHVRNCLQAAIASGDAQHFIYGLPDSLSENICEKDLGDCTQLEEANYDLYRIEEPLRHMVTAHSGSVTALEPVPDYNLSASGSAGAASGGSDGSVHIWDVRTGTKVRSMLVSGDGASVLALAFITGLRALVASTASGFTYYDVETGELLKHVPVTSEANALSHVSQHGLLAMAQGESIDLWNVLERCVDGRHPVGPATCELCPRNRAGYDGSCQIQCKSGNWSSEERTRCEPCPPGRGGSDGQCLECQPGRYQDARGKVSCKPCPAGRAQAATGQQACLPCVDNTAALAVGLDLCQECPDGEQPSPDHTNCTRCSQGRAGIRGTCFQCAGGMEPNPDLSACIPCKDGMAGTGGLCHTCKDGSQPGLTREVCEACPPAFAGRGGSCSQCGDGEMPAADRASCRRCPPARAGRNGTCKFCSPGFAPNDARTVCQVCADGAPSLKGVCTTCEDGNQASTDLTACVPCPAGKAGRGGRCSTCPWGMGPDFDLSECAPCPAEQFSSDGVCTQCPDGTTPNASSKNVCMNCPPGRAGTEGICEQCSPGRQQDSTTRTFCEPCPPGSASPTGICEPCKHPLIQDVSKSECTLQRLPSYHAFTNPRCSAHSNCSRHFRHLQGLDEGRLFCCPTEHGDILACCAFDKMESNLLVTKVTWSLDFMTSIAEGIWPLAALGLLPVAFVLRWLWKMEDWEEMRDRVDFSVGIKVLIPLGVLVWFIVSPWFLVALVIMGWVPFLTVILMRFLNRLLLKMTAGKHLSRKEAWDRVRFRLLLVACIGDLLSSFIQLIQEILVVRFLLADTLSSLEFIIGFAPVAHYPIAHAFEHPTLRETLQLLVGWPLYLLILPQVFFSNVVVCIDYQAKSFSSTLLAAAGLALAQCSSLYLMQVCDLYGRLAAAQESVFLTESRTWPLKLGLLHFVELVLHLIVLWAALVPARLGPLLLQLWWRRPWAEGMFAFYVEFSLVAFASCVQILIFFMFIGIADGAHIQNPPAWLARILEYLTKMEFEDYRREQYLVRAVFRALELIAKDQDDVRSLTFSGTFNQSGSMSLSRTGTRLGWSPFNKRGRAPAESPKKKALKSIISVKKMLKMHADTSHAGPCASPRNPGRGDGSPRMGMSFTSPRGILGSPAGSPRHLKESRSFTSPRRAASRATTPGSPREVAVQPGRHMKFVRLVDGTHADLSRGRKRGKALRSGTMHMGGASRPGVLSAISRATFRTLGTVSTFRSTRSTIHQFGCADWFEVMTMQEWNGKRVEDLKMTPLQLYNRVPPPKVKLTCRNAVKSMLLALRASICTSLGLWRKSWNVTPHCLRRRTRNLTKEFHRSHYDSHDYAAMVWATSKTVGLALSWLPGGACLCSVCGHLNRPPLKICDSSLDIAQHKMEEYLERGMSKVEASAIVAKMVIYKQEHKRQLCQLFCLELLQRLAGLALTGLLLYFEVATSRGTTAVFAPSLMFALFVLTVVRTLIRVLLLPFLQMPHQVRISVRRDVPEEKSLKDAVAAAMVLSESEGGSEAESSEYSSGNDSILDENPRKPRTERRVYGVRRDKVIIRPKACRLQMRLPLLRGMPGCRELASRWQQQDPEKYGRLLQSEGDLSGDFEGARRRSRSFSFQPTEGSDLPLKVLRHRLRRCHSLAQQTAEEQPELRHSAEKWQGTEVCDEAAMPPVPVTSGAMRPRGIIDEFEALAVFREEQKKVTNRDLCCAAPWKDTPCAINVERSLYPEAPQLPWEQDVDEALDAPQLVELAPDARGSSAWARRVAEGSQESLGEQ